MRTKPSYPAIPKANQGLRRMSPGVYRNQAGELVNSRGGALPGRRPPQGGGFEDQINSQLSAATRPPKAMPSTRPPQGGGFVDQINSQLSAATRPSKGRVGSGANFDSMLPGLQKPFMNLDKTLGLQLSKASRPATQGQWSQQMEDLEEAFNAYNPSRPTIQKRPGPAFQQGQPTPEQIASWTQRAEAIRNGGPVTFDRNPARDEWIENYLGQNQGRPRPITKPRPMGQWQDKWPAREGIAQLYDQFAPDDVVNESIQSLLRKMQG